MMEASPNMAAAADGDTIPQGESYPGSLVLSPQARYSAKNGWETAQSSRLAYTKIMNYIARITI